MSNNRLFHPEFNYDAHARTCAPDDFLGQVRRTIQGVPVPDDQIQMIVEAINSGLDMRPYDVLLELACGNGAFSHFLFDSCKEYLGIDVSDYLISIAKKNFEILPDYRYAVDKAEKYIRHEQNPEKFTKVLCYAGFQYFSFEEANEVLESINKKFINVKRVFIGNLPDKNNAAEFYKKSQHQPSLEELSDHSTAIGIWRTKDEFSQLAVNAGWKVKFSTMPPEFYASHYRYDALLSR